MATADTGNKDRLNL